MVQINILQNHTIYKFYLQKYHKLGYDIERMFEQKIRMEKKRTYCPLFTTIGINAEAQTVHHEM